MTRFNNYKKLLEHWVDKTGAVDENGARCKPKGPILQDGSPLGDFSDKTEREKTVSEKICNHVFDILEALHESGKQKDNEKARTLALKQKDKVACEVIRSYALKKLSPLSPIAGTGNEGLLVPGGKKRVSLDGASKRDQNVAADMSQKVLTDQAKASAEKEVKRAKRQADEVAAKADDAAAKTALAEK
jgi:hypothetical protein